MIRRAHAYDVPEIAAIINDCAEHGLMLHRSLAYLYEHLRDFYVSTEPDNKGADSIVGTCGLKVIWADLAEVYALAVTPQARGKGLGGMLVQACIDDAEQLGVCRLMALTYEQRFFTRLGFETIDRQQLPLKVWSECVGCAKNQACDEIAMLFTHQAITPAAPAPPLPPPDSYEVPVVLNGRRTAGEPRTKMDEAI